MKHKNSLKLLSLIAVYLTVTGSCQDDIINESYSSEKPSSGQLSEMKHYFETTAPTLRQLSFDAPHDEHATRKSTSPQKIANLSPNWDKARIWDGNKLTHFEIPLKGEGLYSNAIFRSGGEAYSYPTRSFLVMVKHKESENINYHVVTVIPQRVGHKNSYEEEFYYVGNTDLEGLLIFSRLNGTPIQALHLRNGKSRMIHLGNDAASTRSANADSSSEESCTLSLVSSTSTYTIKESCDPTCDGCCSNCEVLCALCRMPYCINNGDCPNNCGVEVPGSKWETCSTCGADYDMTSFSSCPNCPRPFVCPICGKDPCKCRVSCEKCGSIACPGGWYCSSAGGGSINPPPPPPKPIKWSGDPGLDSLKSEFLKKGLKVDTVLFKRGGINEGCPQTAYVDEHGNIVFCLKFFDKPLNDQISVTGHELYHIENEHHTPGFSKKDLQELSSDMRLPDLPEYLNNYYKELYTNECLEFNKNPSKEMIDQYVNLAFLGLLYVSKLMPPEYNKNEIEAYQYEINNFSNVSYEHKIEREHALWKNTQLYELSIKYYKK